MKTLTILLFLLASYASFSQSEQINEMYIIKSGDITTTKIFIVDSLFNSYSFNMTPELILDIDKLTKCLKDTNIVGIVGRIDRETWFDSNNRGIVLSLKGHKAQLFYTREEAITFVEYIKNIITNTNIKVTYIKDRVEYKNKPINF